MGDPRISVVIATYRPGDAFDRVVASLDAQTMPAEEFEVVVIDDGSADGTLERLDALAAARPNWRVRGIENSGWPSRPRNLGTELAHGEHVFYLDHDDELFPDALRRMAEFAAETGADVVSTQERQTRSVWVNLAPFRRGNVADANDAADVYALMPMVPHKLYRRAFLQEHGIRFPEGRRQLWEDIVFNATVWGRAEVVALLADTQVYLWHEAEGTNTSGTYGPEDPEFWDGVDALCAAIDEALEGERNARARRDLLVHQWRGRGLRRFAKLAGLEPELAEAMLPRARAALDRWVPPEAVPGLGLRSTPHTLLVESGETAALGRLWSFEQSFSPRFGASRIRWEGGVLAFEVEATWADDAGDPLRILRRGERLVRDVPEDVAALLPEQVIDVTDALGSLDLRVAVFSRAQHVTWEVAVVQHADWRAVDGGLTPVVTGVVRLDPATTAGGRPLPLDVWEATAMLHWSDLAGSGPLAARFRSLPALTAAGPAVAFSTGRSVALDLSGAARNIVGDGGMPVGPVGPRIPLPRVQAAQPEDVPVTVHLRAGESPSGVETPLPAALEARDGAVHLVLLARPPSGRYRLAFQTPGGVVRYGRWRLRAARSGGLELDDRSPRERSRARRRRLRGIPAGLLRRLGLRR